MQNEMLAHIPLALSECLTPRELGELLDEAAKSHRKVDDLIVSVVRSHLEQRRHVLTEGAGANPVMGA